jgi:hypothetical protein
MKQTLIILFVFIGLFSVSQELELDDGIYSEKVIKNDTASHRYTIDNISYKLGRTFIYDYYYLDKSGSKFKFIRTENYSEENPLHLIPIKNINDSTIDKIRIEVSDHLEIMSSYDTTYTQTVFDYSYLDRKGKTKDTLCEYYRKKLKRADMNCMDEGTGVIDNKKNLWIHPPRQYTFKMLELCPFPFHYLDESIKKWGWNLGVGGFYLDPRWINQKEKIQINYEYLRGKDETISTPFGKINCKVTNGTAKSELQSGMLRTYLKSYYHPNYGFVKLEYTTINGSKIVMDLIEMKE